MDNQTFKRAMRSTPFIALGTAIAAATAAMVLSPTPPRYKPTPSFTWSFNKSPVLATYTARWTAVIRTKNGLKVKIAPDGAVTFGPGMTLGDAAFAIEMLNLDYQRIQKDNETCRGDNDPSVLHIQNWEFEQGDKQL